MMFFFLLSLKETYKKKEEKYQDTQGNAGVFWQYMGLENNGWPMHAAYGLHFPLFSNEKLWKFSNLTKFIK